MTKEEKEEKALIRLSDNHQKLVKGLKDALRFIQLSFLQAGKYLYKIYTEKTYKAEDSSEDTSFPDFCKRPDLALPGRTEASRLRTAQRLIRVYKFFVIQKGYSEKQLAPIGYSKLDLLVAVIETREKEADEWLNKALLLTANDLIKEIQQRDKSLGDILECRHLAKDIQKIIFYRCKCGTQWKEDPHKKHGKVDSTTNKS